MKLHNYDDLPSSYYSELPCPSCPILARCLSDRPIVENKPGYDAPDYNDLFRYRIYADILLAECQLLKDYMFIDKDLQNRGIRRDKIRAFFTKGYEYDAAV